MYHCRKWHRRTKPGRWYCNHHDPDGKTGRHIKLVDVLHIPFSPHNLISLGKIERQRPELLIRNGTLHLINPQTKDIILQGKRVTNNLYTLDIRATTTANDTTHALAATSQPGCSLYD